MSLESKRTATTSDNTDSFTSRELATRTPRHVTGIDQKNSASKIASLHVTTSPVDQTSNSATGSTLDPLQRHPSRDNTQVAGLAEKLQEDVGVWIASFS